MLVNIYVQRTHGLCIHIGYIFNMECVQIFKRIEISNKVGRNLIWTHENGMRATMQPNS